MRVFSCLASLLISVSILSCSSTSDGDSAVKEEVAAEQPGVAGKIEAKEKAEPTAALTEASAEVKNDCTAPPVATVCCQAMTPTCNECREKSRLVMETWQKTCGGKMKSAGCGAPPVASCCKGSDSACQSCRAEAQAKIAVWRKSCGTKEAINCAEKPSTEQCCATGEPSCDACKKRIGRLLMDFSRKCGK